jgi:hypothetical protein
MAANSYYNSGPPIGLDNVSHHLKPAPYAQTTSVPYGQSSPAPSIYSTSASSNYKPIAPSPYTDAELYALESKDKDIKKRIRTLRIISRALAVLLSAATLTPLTITLVKFFQTRNQTMVVDGEERTAWASGTIAWYTYMYFGISLVSFILNTVIMISYCRGVKGANQAAKYASWWTYIVLGGHVVVWAVSVGIYRSGKEPVNGSFKDLWGWTCSAAADDIQSQITNINFKQYCTIQVSDNRPVPPHTQQATNGKSRRFHSSQALRTRSRGY